MTLVIYVGAAQADEWPAAAAAFAEHVRRFHAASGGAACRVLSYADVTPALLEQLAPQAVS